MSYRQYLLDQIANPNTSDRVVELHYGNSVAHVRPAGAVILDTMLSLDSGPVEVLTTASGEVDVRKISASHSMFPVGENDFLPEKHGADRLEDYDTTQINTTYLEMNAMRPRGITPLTQITRTVELSTSELVVETRHGSMVAEAVATSAGEHLYLAAPADATVGNILVNGQTIDDLLKQDGAFDVVMSGKPMLWNGFNGMAELQTPDYSVDVMSTVTVSGREDVGDQQEVAAALLWKRSGTASFCFEPVHGLTEHDGVFTNTGLWLPAFGKVAMTTIISRTA